MSAKGIREYSIETEKLDSYRAQAYQSAIGKQLAIQQHRRGIMTDSRLSLAKEKMQKVTDSFAKSQTKAEKLISDPEKTKKVVNEAIQKSKGLQGPLNQVWEDLQAMFGIVIDWIKGDYTKVPTGSIILIVAALLYFLSPIDVIPDFIPVIGYIDDVFVISLAIAQVHADLQSYRVWAEARE